MRYYIGFLQIGLHLLLALKLTLVLHVLILT